MLTASYTYSRSHVPRCMTWSATWWKTLMGFWSPSSSRSRMTRASVCVNHTWRTLLLPYLLISRCAHEPTLTSVFSIFTAFIRADNENGETSIQSIQVVSSKPPPDVLPKPGTALKQHTHTHTKDFVQPVFSWLSNTCSYLEIPPRQAFQKMSLFIELFPNHCKRKQPKSFFQKTHPGKKS